MKLTVSLSINFKRSPKEREEAHHPKGDNFSTSEISYQPAEPELQMGFQRY